MSKTIVVSGDWHIGEGDDRHALGVAFSEWERLQPDTLIANGDIIDCKDLHKTAQGRRVPVQRGEGSLRLGEEVTAARQILKRLRKILPRTRIVYVEGNHEARYPRYLARQNPEAYEHLPHLPDLLGLEALGIEWQPYGVPLRVGNFYVIHGWKCNLHSCRTLVQDFMASAVQGHSHRLKAYPHTTPAGITYWGIEGGHLRNRRAAYTPTEWPQWQQGYVVLTETGEDHYTPTLVPIEGLDRAVVVPGSGVTSDTIHKGFLTSLKTAARRIAAARTAEIERSINGRIFEE